MARPHVRLRIQCHVISWLIILHKRTHYPTTISSNPLSRIWNVPLLATHPLKETHSVLKSVANEEPSDEEAGLGVAKGMYNQYPSGYGLCSIYLYTYTFTDICDGKMYGWIFIYIYIYDLCEYTTYVNTSAAGIPSAQHFSGLPPRHKAWSMAKPKGKRPLTALITSQQQI